jgi:ketosteroid isomerase-like protein
MKQGPTTVRIHITYPGGVMKTLLMAFVLVASAISMTHSAVAQVDKAIIAREKASVEAWQKKDKAFYMDFLADDATYFGPRSPYLEIDPKVNFLPKFEMYTEQFKYLDFQMYNPRVQVYGDAAVLTYNEAVTTSIGGKVVEYTGKVTSVYVKQGNTWRVVHGHETINPGMQ